jgi:hypothetical protein
MSLLPQPVWQATDSSGLPIIGAKLHTYAATTTTDQAVYLDAALTSPASNPVVANAAGRFPALWTAGEAYHLVLRGPDVLGNPGDVEWEIDNYRFPVSQVPLNTVSDLRSQANKSGQITTLGHTTVGDGYGGIWNWNASSTATDNGYTIVKPSDRIAIVTGKR